jgi:5-carboxymethyl-2-hydroxymuconate isomerase
MPHLILEYSNNLAAQFKPQELLAELHQTLAYTGVVKLAGIKSRAIGYDIYRVAEGDPAYGFVHLTLQIGHGRDLETRRQLGEKVFEVLQKTFAPVFEKGYCSLSLEVQELHPDLNFKMNNLHGREC